MVASPRPQGFPPEKRLRKRAEFSKVYAHGRAWSHPLLRLRVLPNGLGVSRFGFAIGKRVGKAVVRNRTKRRLRETVRQMDIRPGYDVVIIGQPAAATSSYQALRAGVMDLLTRARLL